MRRLLFLSAISMLVMAMLAPAALAQSRGPSGADGTYNCSDFDDQGQAQEFFLRAGGPGLDPNGLDEDNDGVACESLPTATPPRAVQPQPQPQMMEQTAMTESTAVTSGSLPQSGGASLLLPTSALLVGSGLLALTISRCSR